jgi:hypothetical protein
MGIILRNREVLKKKSTDEYGDEKIQYWDKKRNR